MQHIYFFSDECFLFSTFQSKVILYDIEGDKLKESGSIPTNGKVTDLKFSPDEKSLAMCTGNKQVKVVSTSDYEVSPS